MAKRFKFILTLPDDFEVDSSVRIHNHSAWPNYSQAEPVIYKGIFDTYEEAQAYAENFSIYKYTCCGYDSWYDEEEPRYYVSVFDAEDAAAAACDVEPGDLIYPHPDDYKVEQVEVEDELVYKYCLYYNDDLVYDSSDQEVYFETAEEAEAEAQSDMESFEVEEDGESPYQVEEVEILGIRIEEMGDFIVDCGSLIKYIGQESTVIIPDGVWRIANYVFRGRESITRVELPASLENIHVGAFADCPNLETVVFSEGQKNIAAECFRNCTKLETVHFPKSLEKVYDGVFQGCTNLKEVVIPGKATELKGEHIFDGCDRVVVTVAPNSRGKRYVKTYGINHTFLKV